MANLDDSLIKIVHQEHILSQCKQQSSTLLNCKIWFVVNVPGVK